MTTFDVRTVDLDVLNSVTKYPSIPTYHALDPSNGGLLEEPVEYTGQVIGSEKIDGCNGRIVSLPDHTYLIGSREELLYAKGDLIGNPIVLRAADRSVIAKARFQDYERTIRRRAPGSKRGGSR
jgi:hypothetical protein